VSRSRPAAFQRDPEALQPLTRLFRTLMLIGYFGLLTLLTAKFTILGNGSGFPVALTLLILVAPLLLPLRGLLRGRPRSHLWACFLSLFYFSAGVFNAAGEPAQPWIPLLEIILSVLLFMGALLYLRFCDGEQSAGRPAS